MQKQTERKEGEKAAAATPAPPAETVAAPKAAPKKEKQYRVAGVDASTDKAVLEEVEEVEE